MNKPRSVVASRTTSAAPERVWELASDLSRYAQWVESTVRVTRVSGPAQLGATYDEVSRIAGPWKAPTTWRVTEFEPTSRQVHAGEGVLTARDMAVIIEVSPTSAGSSVSVALRYTPRFGVVGALIDRVIERSLQRAQDRSLEAFVALL